ncbi:uncharacterized protein LOC128229973 isoform X2 [Mya arenaria]|uniref:uncharacterized protein LOC128229973 isoform X2 n=1 Tax=Mya arenaria TaxID=6604 RepID=UPI0022E81BF8|nr:uncharacterized protein LOC128229973 isoform X2 [Mya arenaria]
MIQIHCKVNRVPTSMTWINFKIQSRMPGRITIHDSIKGVAAICFLVLIYRIGWNGVAINQIVPDLPSVVLMTMLLLLVDIWRLQPGRSHSIRSLLKQYFLQRTLYIVGLLMHKQFNKLSNNVTKHQAELLLEILKTNAQTNVGQHFDIGSVQSVDEYRSKVPLTRYADYERFASEVCDKASENVFFPGQADYIAKTSGTTSGRSKLFPKSVRLMRRTAGKWLLLSQKCFLEIHRNNFLRKWLAVRVNSKACFSDAGIRTGPISGLGSSYSLNPYVVPDIVQDVDNEEDVIYINLVFGLKTNDICNLFFSTSQMALLYFQVLERKWTTICSDVEKGEITGTSHVTDEMKQILGQCLNGPDLARAMFLRKEFNKGFTDIVTRIWPNCPGLFCLATGSFQTQADIVRNKYLGEVPLFSPFHAGSEAFYGINLHLHEPEIAYTAMSPFIFFEFIHESQLNETDPDTLLCHEVTVGELYEIVVTTWEGLYRYRSEDVVQVTGFNGTIPRYKFCRRAGDILSVDTDRVPEMLLANAVRKATNARGKPFVDFVSTESTHIEDKAHRGYYAVFIELEESHIITEEDNMIMDEELRRLHECYDLFRKSGKLAPVRLFQVTGRSFELLAKAIIALNQSTSMQYKLPRIIRRRPLLEHLMSHKIDAS